MSTSSAEGNGVAQVSTKPQTQKRFEPLGSRRFEPMSESTIKHISDGPQLVLGKSLLANLQGVGGWKFPTSRLVSA